MASSLTLLYDKKQKHCKCTEQKSKSQWCERRRAGGGKGAVWCCKERRCGMLQTYEEQGAALSSTLQKAATLAKLSGLPEAAIRGSFSLSEAGNMEEVANLGGRFSPVPPPLLTVGVANQTPCLTPFSSVLLHIQSFSLSVPQRQQDLSLRQQNTKSKDKSENQTWCKIQDREKFKREL